MTLKVFLDQMSQPSRAVLIFCRAANIPHELKSIRLAKMEHKSDEFSKITKFQTVPVIVDGETAIRESSAILRYLSQTRNVPDHWYPKDPVGQARVDEYLHWNHLNTRASLAMYFRMRFLMPIITQKAADPAKLAKQEKLVVKCLDDIEKLWLDNGKQMFLCGDKITVADIQAACEMEQTAIAGFDVRANRPIISAYLDRVKKELNPHYDDVHKVLLKMQEKTKGMVPGLDAPKAKL